MITLLYKPDAAVEDLVVGECTMHRAVYGDVRYWHLWFRVLRSSDNQPEDFCVPMNPNGGWIENGPGGKTWGLTTAGGGIWQVAPSINVLATRLIHPGEHPEASLWHDTPTIVNVPGNSPWITEAA